MRPDLHSTSSLRASVVIAQIALVAGLYFLSAKFGLSLAFVNASATAVWPPSGLALAAVLLLGRRVWPGILAGAFLANITTAGTLGTTMAIATGNTMEAVIGGWLIQRWAGGSNAFDRATNIFRFIICGPVLASAISASVGVTSLSLGGFSPWSEYLSVWYTWWLGDMVGMLIITPLLVVWSREPLPRWHVLRLIECAALGILIILIGGIVFGGWFSQPIDSLPRSYLCMPPLVWAAFRFHQRGAMAASFFFSCIALWGTLNEFGPFALADANSSLLALQAFMGTITVTMLVLGALAAQRRRQEIELSRAEERYRSLVLASAQVIWIMSAEGEVVEDLPTWRVFTGQAFEQMRGRGWMSAVHPDDVPHAMKAWEKSIGSGSPFESEFRVRRLDGQYRVMLVRAVAVREANGTIREWVGMSTDITERKTSEQQLNRYQASLEHLVRERTTALEASHQRLRLSERLAAMGTLSVGIGHDLGNLLLPVRIRLDALESMALPESAQEHTVGIRECIDYLHALARNLRLFAQDPEREFAGGRTDLARWLQQVNSFYRSVLPKNIVFETDVMSDLPAVGITAHVLTQAMFNLITNALDAIGSNKPGRVRLWAELIPGEEAVRIGVEDDGPGMNAEVSAHALEPFFTTKSRSLSTGLGLSTVHGLVEAAGGRVEIKSPIAEGHGTSVMLIIPMARRIPHSTNTQTVQPSSRTVAVSVQDQRRGTYLMAVLGTLGFTAVAAGDDPGDSMAWFTDPLHDRIPVARAYLQQREGRVVVAVGDATPEWHDLGAESLTSSVKFGEMRGTLSNILRKLQTSEPLIVTESR